MLFFVPKWVRHGQASARGRSGIYSVDIQPNAHRLATAGQDGSVKIWSLPVIAAQAKPAPSPEGQPKAAATPKTPAGKPSMKNGGAGGGGSQTQPAGALLASMSCHISAVNCVRWAPTGDRVASGADDHIVLVYEREAGSAPVSAFKAAEGGGVENWRVLPGLRAHSGDVTHVCWSPDGQRLASASVDNLVIIWNVRAGCAQVRLEGHTGFVKGVAWDPVGKYVASQSDDRSVRVWRTADWREERTISKPFDSAVYTDNTAAFFLRLSFSPCGGHLLATNARKKTVHCAPMFSRESGFAEQIDFVGHQDPIVCTRFSGRLYRSRKEPEKPPYSLLVLGSKDAGATVWHTIGVVPFFRMKEMFEADVVDLAWGSDGYTLVACSMDGQVMYIRFTPDEIGDVVPLAEANAIFKDKWRKFGGAVANGGPPPEYPAQVRPRRKEPETPDSAMPPPPDAPDPAEPAMPPPPPVVVANEPTPRADPARLAMQKEVRVKGGKRRIMPVAVVTGSNGPTSGGTTPLKRVRVDAPSPFAAADGKASLPFGASAPPVHSFGSGGNLPGVPSDAKPLQYATPLCPASVVGLSLMLLPATNEAAGGRVRIISAGAGAPVVLEAREDSSAAGGFAVICTRGGSVLWRDYHARDAAIVALAGMVGRFAAAANADGMLFVYSAASGRRMLQPLVLDSAPHMMEAFVVRGGRVRSANTHDASAAANGSGTPEKWFLLVVSRSALCSVYDVREKRLVCARSAAPLLACPSEDADAAKAHVVRSIAVAQLTADGEPVLVLSNRQAFVYSRGLRAWGAVAGDTSPNSDFSRRLPSAGAVGPLRALHAGAGLASAARPAGIGLSGMSGLTRAAVESLAHLESLLEAAVSMNAPQDYRYYLANYAARIALAVADDVENCELRLRELCDGLIGGGDGGGEREVLGMSGRKLVEETVLPAVGGNRALQRFVEEYTESVAEMKRREEEV